MTKKVFTKYLCIPTENMIVLSFTNTQTGINILYSRISSKFAHLQCACTGPSFCKRTALVFKRDEMN